MNELTGKQKNLIAQLDAMKRHCNEKSYKSRARYYEAAVCFCKFAAHEFGLQKFSNVSAKHIYSYVEYMKEKGLSPCTIESDLSGIRFFHRLSGGKNILPDNDKLHLEKRIVGAYDRAWLVGEIENAFWAAKEMGRTDVAIAIRIGERFGLRIEEICKLRVEYIQKAMQYEHLYTKGKGGRERFIPAETRKQWELLSALSEYARKKGLQPGDYLISSIKKRGVEKEIKSIQSWIRNHQEKFVDPSCMTKGKPGQKPKIERLTFHGLRHYYTQEIRKFLQANNTKNVEKAVSERLGHHRSAVTRIYEPEY